MTDEVKDPAAELAELKERLAAAEEKAKGFDALKAKNEELLGETKAAKAARREAEEKAKAEAAELAKKSGDVEAVEKHLREHFSGEIEARESKLKARDALIQKYLVTDAAAKIAADIAVDTDAIPILSEYISNRLAVQERDGAFSAAVMGADGKPTGLSLDEFTKQVQDNKALARLIKASGASGGGASGSKGGGAAPAKKVGEWTDGDKARFIRENGLDAWKEKLASA